MNHPHEDQLLLLAYDELPAAEAPALEVHLAACPACREQLAGFERTRVALDWAVGGPTRHRRRWVVTLGALAAAAVLAIVLLRPRAETPFPSFGVHALRYTAPALAPIDSLLTRLEQEKPYAIP